MIDFIMDFYNNPNNNLVSLLLSLAELILSIFPYIGV